VATSGRRDSRECPAETASPDILERTARPVDLARLDFPAPPANAPTTPTIRLAAQDRRDSGEPPDRLDPKATRVKTHRRELKEREDLPEVRDQ